LYLKPYCTCGICRSRGHHRDRGGCAEETIRCASDREIKIGNIMPYAVMKQAANLKNFPGEVLVPGIKINTGTKDFSRSNRCS
jgi:hypothetical protein